MELKILRVQAALAELPLTVVSTFLAGGVADGVREAGFGERLLAMVRRRKLAEFAEIGCEAEAWRFLTLARELGLGVKVGGGAIAIAAQIGATTVDDVSGCQ